MKKLIPTILTAALILSNPVLAGSNTDDLASALDGFSAGAKEFDFDSHKKKEADKEIASFSTDEVAFTDTSVSIRTDGGVLINYENTDPNVWFITQDIQQQALAYLIFYPDNPTETAAGFVSDGMHLNIYDSNTGTDIYLYVNETPLSGLVQNLNAVKEADVAVVQQVVETNYYPGADVTVGTIGNDLWFFADRGTYGVLLSFVNGKEIECGFGYADSSGPVTGLTLLEKLSVTAV